MAPATANIIGKFANGIADDFLVGALSGDARAGAPRAGDEHEHVGARGRRRRIWRRSPRAACGSSIRATGIWPAAGSARAGSPSRPTSAAAADALVRPVGSLVGRAILVTAGPTYEDLDPVRFVGNRSSGRMGFAIAAEAARRGARVSLVSGPTELPAPPGRSSSASAAPRTCGTRSQPGAGGRRRHHGGSGGRLHAGTGARWKQAAREDDTLTIRLVRTPDILAELGARRSGARPVLVGFAAETGDPETRAREKLRTKNVDLIVANDVSRADAGFEVDDQRRHPRQPRWRRAAAAAVQGRARRRYSRSRRSDVVGNPGLASR